jgi:hypothetical protein
MLAEPLPPWIWTRTAAMADGHGLHRTRCDLWCMGCPRLHTYIGLLQSITQSSSVRITGLEWSAAPPHRVHALKSLSNGSTHTEWFGSHTDSQLGGQQQQVCLVFSYVVGPCDSSQVIRWIEMLLTHHCPPDMKAQMPSPRNA